MTTQSKIFVSSVFKSGTKLIEQVVRDLSGLEIETPRPTASPDYGDAGPIVFPKGRFFVWHNTMSPAVKTKLRRNRAKVVLLVRNIYDLLVSQYHHFALDVDLEIGSSTGTRDYFGSMGLDAGLSLVIAGGRSQRFTYHGFGAHLAQIEGMLRFSTEYPCFVVTYESLVRDKVAVLERLAAYLEVDAGPERIAAIAAASGFDAMKSARRERFGSVGPFRKGRPGDHVHVLGPHHYAMISHQVATHAPGLGALCVELGIPGLVGGIPARAEPAAPGSATLMLRRDVPGPEIDAVTARMDECIAGGDPAAAVLHFVKQLVERPGREAALEGCLDPEIAADAAAVYRAVADGMRRPAGTRATGKAGVRTIPTDLDGTILVHGVRRSDLARFMPAILHRRGEGKPGFLITAMPDTVAPQLARALGDGLGLPEVRVGQGLYPQIRPVPAWVDSVRRGGCVAVEQLRPVPETFGILESGGPMNVFLCFRDPRDSAWIEMRRKGGADPQTFLKLAKQRANWLREWTRFAERSPVIRVHLAAHRRLMHEPQERIAHLIDVTGYRGDREAMARGIADATRGWEGDDEAAGGWREALPPAIVADAGTILTPYIRSFLQGNERDFRL
ncbi:hypothetical protein HL658_24055 [Azospirillum sp. RWY-5-1]|uniref:Sulfotransferase domain-containing protein n=1 Tax=Azospirillum oleiclasticum TaxID=2735135 RepID=A0ABX2TE88_9PROT|nr:sulfotransferase domain-containing protein [Azospirillum oleiclasticum]NYZ15626.1 hypothetical protein [Azospirillum oleiclasticum]NYZ22649.1 hypothetical protein [Azospirillum oleiclasticum]